MKWVSFSYSVNISASVFQVTNKTSASPKSIPEAHTHTHTHTHTSSQHKLMCCLVCDGLKAWPSWCLADLDSRQVSPLTDQHESGENPFKNTQQTSWPRENLKLV